MRGLTVFPHMNLTFDMERGISVAALERAMETDQTIFLVTQREIGVEVPGEKDLYEIGTLAHVSQVLRLSSTAVRRARLRRLWQSDPFLQANVEELPEPPMSEAFRQSPRTEALLRQTMSLFGEYAELSGNVPEEITNTVMDCKDPGYLADFIAQNLPMRYPDKQSVLEELSPFPRLRRLNSILARECNVLGFWSGKYGKVWRRTTANRYYGRKSAYCNKNSERAAATRRKSWKRTAKRFSL